MSNLSNAVNMSFRVDRNLKQQADELFKNLGMNTSVALNMFLTLLSAYVHGARLQYVEFFGKFYSGGGRAFNPLKTVEKYVNINHKKK